MDRLDLSPPSQSVYPTAAGADDVAPLSVARPGKILSQRSSAATSFARVRTARATEYVIGLNLHWHRYAPVFARGEAHAEFVFPLGRAEVDASQGSLDVSLTANSNHDTALLEDLVSESLDRLAYREDLQYQWIRPAPSAVEDERASRSRRFFSFRRNEGVTPRHGSRP